MQNPDFNNGWRASSTDKLYYLPSDRDEDNDTRYYGLVSDNGRWYIIRDVVSTGQTRYVVGKVDYPTNWTNRGSLTYKYIYEV